MAASFSDLPFELVVKIFEELPLHTLRCVVPLVCSTWRDIVSDPLLWLNIQVFIASSPTKQTCLTKWPASLAFFKASPHVQNVTIGKLLTDRIDEILLNLTVYCKNIRHLTIKSHIKRDQLFLINSDVTHLHIRRLPDITEASEPYFPHFRCLKRLIINYASDIQILKVAKLVPEICQIVAKRLVLVCLDDLDCIKRALTLYEIDFTKTDQSCYKNLRYINKMQSISAVDCQPTPNKLLHISQMPLSRLQLHEPVTAPVLPSTALVEFFCSRTFNQLSEIILKQIRIDDEGALAIRNHCPYLEMLDVDVTREDGNFRALSESGLLHILHLPRLSIIDVRFRNRRDWMYRRNRWTMHNCESNLPCPEGLDNLLNDWSEVNIEISLC